MEKVDAGPLREKMFAEYHDYPNPTNDPVTEFERRAAGVIADFAVLMVQEHNERQTPDPILVQGIVSVASIMLQQIVGFAPEHVRPQRSSITPSRRSRHTYLVPAPAALG